MKEMFIILASYISASLALGLYGLAYRSKKARHYLISEDAHRTKGTRALYRSVVINMTVSMVLILAILYGFSGWLFHEREMPLWRFAAEAVTVILIYDFGYYFMHRFLFHGQSYLRRVHAVHHSVRNPRVIDSLMLHPVETVMGLALFFGSVALVGGVHLHTLTVLFTTYTAFNILNHGGIDCPHFPFKLLGKLATTHDRHHHSMKHGNFAAITPLPDMVFGTVEKD
jgi:sterol desaturase/sphingolipid hydroxylase (fatty acid hydroxylase superfamily)